MAYELYDQISLDEFIMIAGNTYTVDFTVYESDGTDMDLGGATVYWVLSPYGRPDYTAVQISGTVTGTNTFEVEFPSSVNSTLSGKYIHQPVVVSFFGKEYRPAQGIINIVPRISYT